MKKTFVLDTSVMLYDSNCINVFEENNIVIPFTAIEELDNFKKNEDQTGRNARAIARLLDKYREKGNLQQGVELESGGILKITSHYIDPKNAELNLTLNDNKILGTAAAIEGSILVTNDINLRLKADACKIPTQAYNNKRLISRDLYTGTRIIYLSEHSFSLFKKNGQVALPKLKKGEVYDIFPNEYIVLINRDSEEEKKALGRYSKTKHKIVKLESIPSDICGISPLNDEQRFLFDALFNDEISLVTLVGKAGTGKTLCSIAAGLHLIAQDDLYSKMLVARPIEPMGKDIGYLPGDVNEKLAPWMKPIYDNIDFILSITDLRGSQIRTVTEEKVEVEALTYIRGRSIPYQFIIVDEAQNLTPHEIKTIVTRAGKGTKIVFTGDTQQIDNPYLDEASNGLVYCLEKMKDLEITAHITLTKGERSQLAEAATNLL